MYFIISGKDLINWSGFWYLCHLDPLWSWIQMDMQINIKSTCVDTLNQTLIAWLGISFIEVNSNFAPQLSESKLTVIARGNFPVNW